MNERTRTYTTADIDEWVRLEIISSTQADAIRQRLPVPKGNRFDLVTIAYYAGASTVLLAYTIFMGQQWQHFSALQQSAIALVTIGALWFIGFLVRRTASRVAGDLLIFAGAGIAPLAVYSLQKHFGLGDVTDLGVYRDFYRTIAPSWLVMDIVSLAVAALAMWLTRFPLHSLLLANWAWFLSLDGARWITRSQAWSWGDREFVIGLIVGLALLALGVTLGARTQRNYSVWLYVYGFPLVLGNLGALVRGEDVRELMAVLLGAAVVAAGVWVGRRGRTAARNAFYIAGHLIVLTNAASIALRNEGLYALAFFALYLGVVVLSARLQSRVFLAFGATGCYGYVSYLAFRTFADTLGFPFALAITGLLIVLSATAYERYVRRWLQERVGRAALTAPSGT